MKENTNFFCSFLVPHSEQAGATLSATQFRSPKKATQKCDIPTSIIRKNYDIFSRFLFANFNNIIPTSLFPEQLKYTAK